ncbi:MAG: Methyltransferase protein [Candidatus Acidoferrum typicum]|nr:Methyltransferase protein [Candidatus Acidoferrum typicum]
MNKYGVKCAPYQFQHAVNLAFHKSESGVYDSIHRDMWASLPQQFALLISDYLASGEELGNDLVIVDVGCGTGLASELLLKTKIGDRVSEIDLLDTSPEMLEKASERASTWKVKTTTIHGGVRSIAERRRRYDLIITCSVLHHIPDLIDFLQDIRHLQAPRGIFMHLQDPNGDYLGDDLLQERTRELKDYERPLIPKRLRRLAPRNVIGRIRRKLSNREDEDYISRVNKQLIQSGLTREPMIAPDIWAVTDIHVHDGEGISIKTLSGLLGDYRMISVRSYSFFGKMASELPTAFKEREQLLIDARALNGLEIAGLWKLMNDR